MRVIKISSFSSEAASMGMGKRLKEILEPLISEGEDIVVDFDGITRFASPFFNNSFSALGIIYGFKNIEKIQRKNISHIGESTYLSSMDNAKLLSENPDYEDKISDIISTAPKNVEG